MPHIIYGLHDPRVTPVLIRYVGCTSKGIRRRLWEHIDEAKHKDVSSRHKWLRSLAVANVVPALVILETFAVTAASWQRRERHWIAKFPAGQLVNSTVGGVGLTNPSQEVRDRIAAPQIGRPLHPNASRKGIKHTEAGLQAIRDGLANSEKARAAWDAKKGINPHANLSPEAIAARNEKLRLAHIGRVIKPTTLETRIKMSLSHSGVAHPESAREKKRGSKFINDGINMKQLKAGQPLPEGWCYGMLKKIK